jgi:aminoglycoside phosphotransferase (APT) family kinase protein
MVLQEYGIPVALTCFPANGILNRDIRWMPRPRGPAQRQWLPRTRMTPETASVRPDEQMDWQALANWLRPRLGDAAGPMAVAQFPGGSANLTYLVRFGTREYVVRRPPLGPVAPGAHDMRREHRVLSRLYRVFPQAPRCYLLCEDERVIGAPFIVIERRTGVVIREAFPASMTAMPGLAARTSLALVDAMADLHNVDPNTCDLADLGRPDGFVARQVAGWYQRWQLAKDRDFALFDAIHGRLTATLPAAQRVSILHNDLKLDNCQFDPTDPDRVKSIFDWDMATLGDPLIDLGTLLGYWPEPGDPAPRAARPTGADDPFPSRADIVQRYAARTGLETTGAAWYEAFALWKTAVVVQQIYIRFQRGQTQDERFASYADRVPTLLEAAWPLVRP